MTTRGYAGNPVGLLYAAAWLTDANGRMYGQSDPDSAANGDEFFPYLLRYPRSAALPSPPRTVVNLTGGDRWVGSVSFGISEMPQFPLNMSNEDLFFKALCSNSSVDSTSNTRWHRSSDNPNLATLPQMGLLLAAQWQNRDAGADGAPLYITWVIPRCTIQPGNPNFAYQAANDLVHTVTITNTDREPHGVLFSTGAMNLANNQAPAYAIVGPKPMMIAGMLGNGTKDTIVLPYLPAGTDVTLNATNVEYAVDGTLTALATISTTTGEAAASGAPTAGQYAGYLYEMDETITISPGP